MKTILTKTFLASLLLLMISGCASKNLDYTSKSNSTLFPGADVSEGSDGYELKTKAYRYAGDMKFYSKENVITFVKEDISETIPANKRDDNIEVTHFKDGKVALKSQSGAIAFGEISITNLNKG